MGMTLESIHVLGGDLEQIRNLMPKAEVGVWSERYVSVFPHNREEFGGKLARRLSKAIPQPVLDAMIFDSDGVEFSVYQDGKRVAQHSLNPEFDSKMGNIPKFCELMGLEPENGKRLRAVWGVADAETQLELTADLLGAPLGFCCEMLPEKMVCRNIGKVDAWIADIPKPKKFKNTTAAEVIQEIEHFREAVNGYDMVRSPMYYMSEEPWFMDHAHDKTIWWSPQPDGSLAVAGEIGERLHYREEFGRLIGISISKGVRYDSLGKLPGVISDMAWFHILEEGRLLVPQGNRMDYLLTCCDAEGYRLWTNYQDAEYLGCGNGAVLLYRRDGNFADAGTLKVRDAQSGAVLGTRRIHSHVVYFHGCQNGIWWVEHSVDKEDEKLHTKLLKLDQALNQLGELELNDNIQQIDFSPDGETAYLFFYQSKVLAVNTWTLAVGNEIRDRTLRIPCGTDSAGRFWMRCGTATLEAWSADLGMPLSRHRLKGEIIGVHFDEKGNLCAAAWEKKKAVLRVYRMR